MTTPDTDILAIADTWSYWDRAIPGSVPRSLALPERLHPSLALVVQGVRRCGKSTLLRQLVGRYALDPTRCAFLNCEDPRLSAHLTYRTLEDLVVRFRERHGDGVTLAFFLDEIQWVEGWERWLRAQLDQGRDNLFVITGSNAHLLSGELGSTLTGRHITAELYPFDVGERRLVEPALRLEEYLHSGGFPEPLRLGVDGERLLQSYFNDIVERDIRERVGARSSRPLRQVVQMIFESAGAELSLRRIAASAGIAVATARAYVEAAEAAYLIFSVPFFAFSERKRASRNQKFYPIDTGLRRLTVTRGGHDRGKSLECAAHLALRRRFGQVFYWRERGEVDFVVHVADRIVPVQVTWDEPEERHHRALDEFYERVPQALEAVFITSARFDEALSRVGELVG